MTPALAFTRALIALRRAGRAYEAAFDNRAGNALRPVAIVLTGVCVVAAVLAVMS